MSLNLLRRLWLSTPAVKPDLHSQRNEHGHLIITVTGLDLTGAQEITRLEGAGYRISNYARLCLRSSAPDGYDRNHRLVAGREYTVAFMPTAEIANVRERTTDNLRRHGIERYGYQKPLAGVVPRIRETISDKHMEEMSFGYVAAPHDPINDSDDDPNVLYAPRGDDGRWLDASRDRPGDYWDGYGAFAFFVSVSNL